jgi:hypothetical protein
MARTLHFSNKVFLFILILTLILPLKKLHAHQMHNTIVFLNVSPGNVVMELQLPFAELELAFDLRAFPVSASSYLNGVPILIS